MAIPAKAIVATTKAKSSGREVLRRLKPGRRGLLTNIEFGILVLLCDYGETGANHAELMKDMKAFNAVYQVGNLYRQLQWLKDEDCVTDNSQYAITAKGRRVADAATELIYALYPDI